MIGQMISHYRILEKLGSGGMGVVYKAEDIKLKRLVALKFLPPELTRDEDAKKRFIHEAQTASALDHPNIGAIHEIDETDEGQLYIVMVYYDGETLKDRMASVGATRRVAPTIDECIDMAMQIAAGLQEAHAKTIVHRDIKPANIIITLKNQVKILDFGLAKLVGKTKLTKTGSTLGTVQYMSPEQTRGEMVDHRTDIWSLGAVLYEIITGRPPFQGEYEQAVIYGILNEEPEPLTSVRTNVPMELERIVNKALAKKSNERYQHMDDLLVDLKKIQENLKAAVTKVPSQKSRGVFATIRRRIWIPFTGLVVLLLFFLIATKLGFRVKEAKENVVENLLAVMHFENLGDPEDSQREAQMISNLIITDLSGSEYVRVVSDQRLYDILKGMGREDQRLLDKSVATRVARRARAAKMLLGQINKLGEKIILTSQLVNVNNGEILESQRVDGTDMFGMTDTLTKLIKMDLALPSLALAERELPVAELTTHSPEAYRYYLQGQDYYNRYNWDAAEQSYRNAVALDSTFALAYLRLAWMQFRFGWGDMTGAQTTSEKVYTFRNRVPEKDRLYIEWLYGAFHGSGLGLAPLERLVVKYPEEKEAWWILATAMGGPMENPLKAMSYHEKWLSLDPFFKVGYPFIVRDCLNLGLFEEGKKYALKYLRIAPNDAAAHHHMGYVYYFQDKPELALDEFQRAYQLEPNYMDAVIGISQTLALQGKFQESDEKLDPLLAERVAPSYQIGAYYQLGWNALALGNTKQAMNDFKKMIQIIETDHMDFMLPFGHQVLGLVYYLSSNFSAAKSEFEYVAAGPGMARNRFQYIASNYLNGIVAVQQARYSDALTMAGHIRQIAEEENNSKFKEWYDGLRAQIKFAQDPQFLATDQVKEFHFREWWQWMTDECIPSEWFLAQIFERRGQIDKAIQFYKILVEQKYPWRVNLLYPKSLYHLARLYQRQGQRDRAIGYYQQFLGVWQNADADVTEKINAKKELAALQAGAGK